MNKLYICYECKGAVIEKNGVEFCSECGKKFSSGNQEIVLDAEFTEIPPEPEPEIENTQSEVMTPEDKLVDDMMNIIKEDEEGRLERRKNLKGFQRIESDVEGAGKIIFDLLTRDY